jgi:prepilin-type N-terminal cleavage/methylation domain-containing protein
MEAPVDASPARRRRGFTLVELILAMAITALLGAVAVPFLVKQGRSIALTSGNLNSQQTVAFALNFIDHDLRVAGIGTASSQPAMIEAYPRELAFNANLVVSDSTDTTALLTAAYYDPSITAALTTLLDSTQALTLPLSSLYTPAVTYPTLDYYQSAGLKSPAQTIVFYMAPDTSSGALAHTYALWRTVNTGTPMLLARGLDTSSVFHYFVPATYFSSGDSTHLDSLVPTGYKGFPWAFSYGAAHALTSADTMLAAITQVSVQLKAVYADEYGFKHYRSVNEMVPLLNTGLSHIAQCGAAPAPPTGFTATARSTGDSVHLSWTRSADEGGGANDIQSYVVYRRTEPSTAWNAIMTVAVGSSDTTAQDHGLAGLGTRYDYALASEDCTPALSSITSTTVTGVVPLP